MRTALSHEINVSELEYLRSQGLSNQQIAAKLDISRATVGKYLPTERKKRVTLSPIDRENIVALYMHGTSAKELAGRFGCSVGTIYAVLSVKNVKLHEPKAKKPEKTYDGPDCGTDSSSLIFGQIGHYDGRLGTYYVDKVKRVAILPQGPTQLSKEDLGYLIRDLMTVWKEM